MASAAEQLAANINFGAFAKAEELKKRIWFTLGALVVYRLGTYIPLPGINPEALARRASSSRAERHPRHVQHVLRRRRRAHGDLRAQHHALHLGLDHHAAADLGRADARGAEEGRRGGRKVINQYTRYLTVRAGRRSRPTASPSACEGSANIVSDPGCSSVISTVITLTGGTMFLMWLGEQITARGIGNGISLIIFAGIVADLPHAHRRHARTRPHRARSRPALILGVIVMAVAVIAFIVFMERAQRRLLIQYPEAPGRQPHVRGRDLVPAAEAQHLGRHSADLRLVAAAAAGDGRRASRRSSGPAGLVGTMPAYLGHGQPLYMLLYAALIVFFAFFYTAIVFNPKETADNLKKHGGFIPGIRPGRAHGRVHRLRADPHHRGRRRSTSSSSACCPSC